MGLRKDIWRPAIVAAPLAEIVARGSIEGLPLHWLPPMGSFRFLADPFGLWRDGRLHVFVETYDYRVRVGSIELLIYDRDFRLLERGPVLVEPWHLSYPTIWEAEGETWMLPEAHRSNALTLYRARAFPWEWEPVTRIALDHVPVDATPLWHDSRWWLFYTSASREADKMTALHIAWADRLTGPWTPHPMNPVHRSIASARPGGTAQVIGGRVMLPVQDCTDTYGGAMRALWFDRLDPEGVVVTPGPRIVAPADAAPFIEGLHTLAAAGPVTLVDMKRTELSAHGLAIEARRELGKLVRTLRR
ncbi:formyl transferase [Sphingomonas naphthae]|uniref:Formyl transferase n=1 Tax=Sphingomonas naphthae TaxID=1813468 RepID=A0ABY7TJB7_9SPHN|nr:formyl transferase [Sphingomonas naphthae]WCT73321.1 formyl transferase [Sphingomonas naphthae]